MGKSNQKLFVNGTNYFEFAHIGWGNLNVQISGYLMGYKDSADVLVDYALSSKDIRTLDTFIYPIVFLYRQFIELSLKSIILESLNYTQLEKQKIIENYKHDLIKLWEKVKKLFSDYRIGDTTEDIEFVNRIQSYIYEFSKNDRYSFDYRYPFDLKVEKIRNENERISLPNLKDKMNELSGFFEGSKAMLEKSYEDLI